MAEEIQEAVQIIRVAFEGVEVAMKIGSGGIGAMQKMADLIKGLLDYEKSIGKTNMRSLLVKGGDLQVFQFEMEDMKKVKKMAKKYGILYSVLPPVNKEQGKAEILFHSEAVPRVNMMVQKLSKGRVTTFEDYLKEEDGKQLDTIMDYLHEEKKKGNLDVHTEANKVIDDMIEKVGMFAMEKDSISVDSIKENFSIPQEQAEGVVGKLETMGVLAKGNDTGHYKVLMDKEAFKNRIRGYQDLAEKMRAVAKSKDTSLVDITISKTLIIEENELAVKTRIPGTWGDNARYIWIRKDDVMEIHGGKTMLTFIDKDKEYKMYDAENRVASTMKGSDLYSKHYDSVEIGVRKRYEKMRKEKDEREKAAKDISKQVSQLGRKR